MCFYGHNTDGGFLNRKLYSYSRENFAARSAICFFLILLMLLSCALRVAVLNTEGLGLVSAKQSEYVIKIKRIRGTVYDCNMVPLTNNVSYTAAVVAPLPEAITAVSKALPRSERQSLLNTLKGGKPAVCTVPGEINCEGVATKEIYKTAGSKDACHIIGYLDNKGHGAAGLEAAYDDILYTDRYISAVVVTDGKGNMLSGIEPEFEEGDDPRSFGVISTVDIEIQKAVGAAANDIAKGAVVVSEVKTGQIKALLSLPQFDTSDISSYLENENSPFINRALRPYSVGSVFKSLVAAAGIESGYADFRYNCEGSTFIIDRYFKCHKADGHGAVDLRQALAFSCNCYFYNYALLLGGERIYKTARLFNFGSAIQIADNVKSGAGTLPDKKTLENAAHLANFSIGQGELSASPVALLPLYTAIANGGRYYLPSLVKATVKDGMLTPYDNGNPTVAMSESTALMLKTYLMDVITDGTAAAAMPKTVTAAGKTATAQTGRVDKNGGKINNSWFCGFFPAEEPEYVVVILSEGGNTAQTSAVFSKIADSITQISKERD